MSKTNVKELYRYDGHAYNDGQVSVTCETIQVTRETEKSFICDELKDWGRSVVVSKTARKRFAYPTKEEALYSFRMRKIRHSQHLERQLRNVQRIQNFIDDWDIHQMGEPESELEHYKTSHE